MSCAVARHYVRRTFKTTATMGSSLTRSMQSLRFLGPLTLLVSVFTLHTLLAARSGSGELGEPVAAKLAPGPAQRRPGAAAARPAPKANHMSRKLLIEMVKSKGLWTDTTRRPIIFSLREKIMRASMYAINRSLEADRELELESKRMKPAYEYWKIGGDSIRLGTGGDKGRNGSESAGTALKRRVPPNAQVGAGEAENDQTFRMNEGPTADVPAAQLPATTYPLLQDEIVYMVKTVGTHQERLAASYQAWGKVAARLIVSSDSPMGRSGVPGWKQRVAFLNRMARRLFQGSPALTCVTTFLNLAKVLQDEELYDTRWLVIVEDDTFVIPDNVRDYLARFEHDVPQYMGLGAPQPVTLRADQGKGEVVGMATAAAGIAYSQGLMQVVRHNLVADLQLTSVHDRCTKAMMHTDAALGLLATDNGAELISRPDLAGFHQRGRPTPRNAEPLSIHLQLDLFPNDVRRFALLSEDYINMTATRRRDFGEEYAEDRLRFL